MVAQELEFSFKLGTSICWFASVSDRAAAFPFGVDASVLIALSGWLGSSQFILNLVTLGSDAKMFLITFN